MPVIDLKKIKIEIKEKQLIFKFIAEPKSRNDLFRVSIIRDRFNLLLAFYFPDLYPEINNEDLSEKDIFVERNENELCVLLNFKRPLDLKILNSIFFQNLTKKNTLSEFFSEDDLEKIFSVYHQHFNRRSYCFLEDALLQIEEQEDQKPEENQDDQEIANSIREELQCFFASQSKRIQLQEKLTILKDFYENYSKPDEKSYHFFSENVNILYDDHPDNSELQEKITNLDQHITRLEKKINFERNRNEQLSHELEKVEGLEKNNIEETFEGFDKSYLEVWRNNLKPEIKTTKSLELLKNNLTEIEPVLLFASLQEQFLIWNSNKNILVPEIYRDIFLGFPTVLFTDSAKLDDKEERKKATEEADNALLRAQEQIEKWREQVRRESVKNTDHKQENSGYFGSYYKKTKQWATQSFFYRKERAKKTVNEDVIYKRFKFGGGKNE